MLTERYYSWEDSRKLARDDPEIDLSGDGQAYTPSGMTDEELLEEEEYTEEELAAAEKEWAESEAAQASKPEGSIPQTTEENTRAPLNR